MPKPGQFSPHCLRHSAITFALDAGVSPRDVQDYVWPQGSRTGLRVQQALNLKPADIA